jgi:hypothetical protein
MRIVAACVAVACVWLAPVAARAQAVDEVSRGAARDIGYAGVAAYQAGDFKTAHERLEKAYALLPVPSLGLWSARALAQVGLLVEAERRCREVAQLPSSVGDGAIQDQARVDARREAASLSARVPKLILRVEGAPPDEVTVTIDGKGAIALAAGRSAAVNPGRHTVEGARGSVRVRTQIEVAEGEQQVALLRFPAEGPAPEALAPGAVAATRPAGDVERAAGSEAALGGGAARTLGWVAIVSGAAGLATGGVLGAVALSRKSELDGNPSCMQHSCPSTEKGAVDGYDRLRIASGVGFIAGAALVATGAVLLFAARPSAEARAAKATGISGVRLAVLPGAAVLGGRF